MQKSNMPNRWDILSARNPPTSWDIMPTVVKTPTTKLAICNDIPFSVRRGTICTVTIIHPIDAMAWQALIIQNEEVFIACLAVKPASGSIY